MRTLVQVKRVDINVLTLAVISISALLATLKGTVVFMPIYDLLSVLTSIATQCSPAETIAYNTREAAILVSF